MAELIQIHAHRGESGVEPYLILYQALLTGGIFFTGLGSAPSIRGEKPPKNILVVALNPFSFCRMCLPSAIMVELLL